MRKLIYVIVIACVFACAAAAAAFARTEGDWEYREAYEWEGGGVCVTEYLGSEEYLTVPSVLGGKSVTWLGGEAFSENEALRTVIVPEGVIGIDTYCFLDCPNLTSVKLPDTLVELSSYRGSFMGCVKLASINIPDGVTALGIETFSGCRSLRALELPESLTEIGTCCFEGCAKLTTIKGGVAVKKIGAKAFSGCKALRKFPVLNELEVIGAGAFRGCVKLAKFTLGEKVNSIGKNAFNGCKALKTVTVKTELLTNDSVGKAAFKGINRKATFKCPKARLKAYKKLLVKKGAPKSCKFK